MNNITIEQYNLFTELIEQDDVIGIFELFKIDISNLSIAEMQTKLKELTSINYTPQRIKQYYIINGTKYKAQLNLVHIKAGQFIDFQTYMANGRNIEQILSVFLIPMKKRFGLWVEQKYGDYDMVKTQSEIKKYFTMSDAKTLSDFFLSLSVRLLGVLRDSLEKKRVKMEKKMKKGIVD